MNRESKKRNLVIMLKYLSGLFSPSNVSLSLIKSYRATDINKIRLHHGPILELGNTVEGITFFMPEDLDWDGPLNRSISAAAGKKLDAYILENIHAPRSGEVYALPGFDSPFKALFMAVVTEWDGGIDFEDRDLVRCYRETIHLAAKLNITHVAFPAMGRDKRDFPHIRFARLAIEGIVQGLLHEPTIQSVTIACTDKRMVQTYTGRLAHRGWKQQG